MHRTAHTENMCLCIAPPASATFVLLFTLSVSGEYTTRLACPCLDKAQGHTNPAPAGGLRPGNAHSTYFKAVLPQGHAADNDDGSRCDSKQCRCWEADLRVVW